MFSICSYVFSKNCINAWFNLIASNLIAFLLFGNRSYRCCFCVPENESFRRSLLIIIDRCESRILADDLALFGAILLDPVAFFVFNSFTILLICLEVTARTSNVFLAVFLLLISKILESVWYFRIIDYTVAS